MDFLVGLFWILLGYIFACKGTICDRKRSQIGFNNFMFIIIR